MRVTRMKRYQKEIVNRTKRDKEVPNVNMTQKERQKKCQKETDCE